MTLILDYPQFLTKIKSDQITLIDMFNRWSGPCVPVEQYLQKQGMEYHKFAIDGIPNLDSIQNDCAPHLFLFRSGVLFFYTNEPDSHAIEEEIKAAKEKKVKGCANSPINLVIVSDTPVTAESTEGLSPVVVIIKPDAVYLEETIVEQFQKQGFHLEQTKAVWLQRPQVESLYEEHVHSAFFGELSAYMTSAPVVIMKWHGSITKCKSIVSTIREASERDKLHNVLYSSKSADQVKKDLLMFDLQAVSNFNRVNQIQQTVLVVWNSLDSDLSFIRNVFHHLGVEVQKEKVMNLTENQIEYFMVKSETNVVEDFLFDKFKVVVLLLRAENVVNLTAQIIGNVDSSVPQSVNSILNSARSDDNPIVFYCSSQTTFDTDTSLIADNTVKPEFTGIQKLLFIIKPGNAQYVDEIMKIIKKNQFVVLEIQEMLLTKEQLEGLYGKLKSLKFYESLIKWMMSEPVKVLVLEKENGIEDMKVLLGPKDLETAKKSHPDSIRSRFSTYDEYWKNCGHSSDKKSAENEIQILFGPHFGRLSRANSLRTSKSKLI